MWTESHSVEEYKLLTGDGNELVSVNIKLVYKIDDLYSYIIKSSSPEQILSSKAYEFMMNKTNATDLDTILSVNRTNLSKELLKVLNDYTKKNNVGLSVEEVIIESIHPPVELSDVYQSVVSADVKKTTSITNAQAEAQTLIIDAEKDAKTVVITAKERQTSKVADATKEMAVYKAALNAYKESPKSFKLSKYLDTYEKVIGGNKVYVFSANIDSELSQYIINSSGKALDEATVIKSEE
jgi:regulator of protease activity HflC (stomatin/prohibitin superfamily)